MPAALADVLAEAERLLEPTRFEDFCRNGLQVPGAPFLDKSDALQSRATVASVCYDGNHPGAYC